MKNCLKKNWFIICLGIFFLFFLYISRYAPVVGDDWGYAVGGRYSNPIVKACQNYMSWSGRFLSELWGFSVAPHKKLWNILNASIFTAIYYYLFKLCKNKKYPVLTAFIVVFLMLSVSNRLRMQTYTWIMGTTYVLPLLLYFVYLSLIYSYIFDNKMNKVTFSIMCLCNLMIPLFMENAAAMLVGGNVLIMIYLYFKDKSKLKSLFILLVISAIGTCIIKFSPGALYRLNRDHEAFNSLSFFTKVAQNWQAFIQMTFTNNTWIICALAILNSVFILQNSFSSIEKSVLVLIQGVAIVPLFSSFTLLWNSIIYILFTISLFYIYLKEIHDEKRKWFVILLLFLAGGANIVMLISPIFDSRSSIYTVYFFILIILNILECIELKKSFNVALVCLTFIGISIYGIKYIRLYQLVHKITIKRESEIAYYVVRPDTTEAYIIGYPDESIHSGNAEPDDTYHMQTFKEYYYLNEDMTVRFYYLKEYNDDTIFGERE